MRIAPLVFMTFLAALLFGCSAPQEEAKKAETPATEANASIRFAQRYAPAWQRSADYTVKLAEAMPEEHYDYQMQPEVFSFKKQLYHCIQFNNGTAMQHLGLSENPSAGVDFETLTKAQLIEQIKKSNAAIGKAIAALTDQQAAQTLEGGKTRADVIYQMHDHTTHHRGQAVMYLRMKGIQPPGGFVGW